jgi:hypothetical protein
MGWQGHMSDSSGVAAARGGKGKDSTLPRSLGQVGKVRLEWAGSHTLPGLMPHLCPEPCILKQSNDSESFSS